MWPQTSLWFLSGNTIAVSFVIGGGKATLSDRGGANTGSPMRLRVVLLDAATGAVKAVRVLSAPSRSAAIVATEGGMIMTQGGTELTLYSPDLSALKSISLPPVSGVDWLAHPSPTGRNVLFVASDLRTDGPVPWIWVHTDNLQVLGSWREPSSGWVGISDDHVAMIACVQAHGCEPYVEVRGLNTGWTSIASVTRRPDLPIPQFVNNNLLLLLGRPTRVLRTDGEVVFVRDLFRFNGCSQGGVPAARGQRFAIPSCKVTGFFPALDMGGTSVLKGILLFDAPFDKPSYALALEGPRMKGMTRFALSPGGSNLAVLDGDLRYLEVFRLPPVR